MPPHRRYTKSQKARAVVLAEATSTEAAAETLRIPRKTLAYWLDAPEFAELRHKSQEDRADGWRVIEGRVQARIIELIPTMDAKEAIVTGGVAAEKVQLLSGQATSRTENVSITDGLDDHEKDALHEAIVGELARRSDESPADPAVGTAGPKGAETPGG